LEAQQQKKREEGAIRFKEFNVNKLKINSPVSEEIYIYSVTGIRLYQKEKTAGEFDSSIGNIHDKILIIRGGSGWVRKIINR
jgi:hypothetical protein